jgi:uncharacterized protein DUF4129
VPELRATEPPAGQAGPIAPLRARAAWLALALGLVVLAAFTSRSAPLVIAWDLGGLSPLAAIEVLGYVALFVGLALVPAAIWFGRQRRRAAGLPTRRRSAASGLPRWASALGFVVVLLVFAGQAAVLLAYLADLQRSGRSPLDALLSSELWAGWERPAGVERGPETLTIALLITAVLAVVVLVVLIAWRRDGPPDGTAVERRHAAAEAVELGLDALRREPDPRRAVIAAYAAMVLSLSRSGFPREQPEAPMEYLRRILTGFAGVAREVATLTHLFQLAKFSNHVVDDEMRGTAIGALERLQRGTERRA